MKPGVELRHVARSRHHPDVELRNLAAFVVPFGESYISRCNVVTPLIQMQLPASRRRYSMDRVLVRPIIKIAFSTILLLTQLINSLDCRPLISQRTQLINYIRE